MNFHLCEECLSRYRVLTFDPGARVVSCHIPFDSILWTDEHKPAREGALFGHDSCLHALIQLTTARKHLWREGRVRPDWESFWQSALELLPNWPGFQRLTLTPEQLAALDACEGETASMMDETRADAAVFVLDVRTAGVVSFAAYPRDGARPGDTSSAE